MNIGERIKKHRLLKGWDGYAELARQLKTKDVEVTPEAVSQYERGKIKPGRGVRKALAELFGVTEAYLEFGHGAAPAGLEAPSDEEWELIEGFRECRPEVQEVVQSLVQVGQLLSTQTNRTNQQQQKTVKKRK